MGSERFVMFPDSALPIVKMAFSSCRSMARMDYCIASKMSLISCGARFILVHFKGLDLFVFFIYFSHHDLKEILGDLKLRVHQHHWLF